MKFLLFNPVVFFVAAWSLSAITTAWPASSTFSFTLDAPCKTSAGVYTPDGTLIRTLWSKVRYQAGTNAAVWDGLDDNGAPTAAGLYQIKLLQHNVEYVWDGAIGNTSAELSGPTVHRSFWPMRGMAISGTNAFYVSGYNEGLYDFRSFSTTDPQRVKMSWYWIYSSQFNRMNNSSGDVNDLNWLWAAADSSRVYFACSATANPASLIAPNNYPGCIISCNIADNSSATFSTGGPIQNIGANSPLPNGIYVGTQPGLSGLSVQPNGNLLAASVAPDNRVYLMDKTTGAAVRSFTVPSPRRLNFSTDGTLWVISGNKVIGYTNLLTNPTANVIIPNFSQPLDVAVNPANPNIIVVADGGGSQQLKSFDRTGASLWSYGLAGGYQSNGATVATNKFWFFDGENDGTFLCFAPDGSFWVGDGGNHRSMHFSGAHTYLEQIMFQPHSYVSCVDQNDSTRVFNQFLEFKVDYSKPLAQGWTLVKNWRANADACHISWNEGLREVTTFTNGRTYAYVDNNCHNNILQELCELGTNYLRFTGIYPLVTNQGRWMSLGPDGSARATAIGSANWYAATLTGFDSLGNPRWNPETVIASAPNGTTDPVPRCCSFGNVRTIISTNNILISFDQSLNDGWHLGAVRVGDNKWLWKTSKAATWMDGLGNFEIMNGVQYPGNIAQVVDRNIIYGYHGEFFRNEGQAAQTMHYYDDGLFVGQFGEPSPGHYPYEGALPGFAGNGDCPSLTKSTNGDYYLWVSDEGGHGPMRWHFVNARNIREQVGSGSLGSAISLTNQPFNFPAGVTGKSGNQCVQLAWLPVAGASRYNLRYSFIHGGPFLTLAGFTTNTSYVVGGLTNGKTYYFAVTAIRNGQEGSPSEEVILNPFDTSQFVFCAGQMTEGGQFTPNVQISSTAMASNLPSYIGSEQMCGLLSLQELDGFGYGNLQDELVGRKGYVLYDWSSSGSSVPNLRGGFSVTPGPGWGDINYLQRQYRLDGTLGTRFGLSANPIASLNISVTDTNFHYLTLISPSQFDNARQFTLRLTPSNNPTNNPAMFSVNENPGLSHVFQFLFRGNVTLWADATGGSGAIVQSVFLDDASVNFTAPPPPLNQFRVLTPR